MGRPERLYEVDPAKTALLVVDMQDAFCAAGACIESPDARAIGPNINRLVKACRKADIPVIWVRFVVRKDLSNAGLWPLMQPASPVGEDRGKPPVDLAEGGQGVPIWKDLDYRPDKEITVDKCRYSAFAPGSSDLERILRTMGRDTLIITGTGTNVCCESTARDAMMLDFKVIFVSDANATFHDVFHEMTLMNIKLFFGDVVSTDQILADLQRVPGSGGSH